MLLSEADQVALEPDLDRMAVDLDLGDRTSGSSSRRTLLTHWLRFIPFALALESSSFICACVTHNANSTLPFALVFDMPLRCYTPKGTINLTVPNSFSPQA